MRIASTALLVGAASAASFHNEAQHILGGAHDTIKPVSDSFPPSSHPLKSFEEALKGMTSEAKALWDEIKMLVPEGAFDHTTWFSSPKPHKRRPDHTWDHVVKGADVQKVWVQDSKGESHREV